MFLFWARLTLTLPDLAHLDGLIIREDHRYQSITHQEAVISTSDPDEQWQLAAFTTCQTWVRAGAVAQINGKDTLIHGVPTGS